MADVINSPIRITDVQQNTAQRHTHPPSAKSIADALTEAPPAQASVTVAQTAANNAATLAQAAQDTANTANTTAQNAQTTANAAIPATEKGQNNGVATLDDDGKVPESQLPPLGGGVPAPPVSGYHVLLAIDGVVSWVEIEPPAQGSILTTTDGYILVTTQGYALKTVA